jgi:hypothetical protein
MKGAVKLPRDISGRPIRLGDVIEFHDGRRILVDALLMDSKGWMAFDRDGEHAGRICQPVLVVRRRR